MNAAGADGAEPPASAKPPASPASPAPPMPPGFAEAWERGETQLLAEEQPADLETPVSVFLKLTQGRPYSALLESVEGGINIGRHSFICTDSDLVWRCQGGQAEQGHPTEGAPLPLEGPPLETLRRLVADNRFTQAGETVPMAGGLVGFLGWEMARCMEQLPDASHPRDSALPDGLFFRPRTTAIFDRLGDRLTLVRVVPGKDSKGSEENKKSAATAASAEEAHAAARTALAESWARIKGPLPGEAAPQAGSPAPQASAAPDFKSNLSPEAYMAMVERGREYIRAGDIYQVVLSQRFSTRTSIAPFDFYRALRRRNPAPFLFFLQLEGAAVAGSSPEVLVRVQDGELTARPLAGSRPRGTDEGQDLALERELLGDEKERAEHLMLLDLGRNDIGRVARPGSVSVPRSFAVERYSRIMHLSSTVTARLQEGFEALDALVATFPAGTLSGAPKIRAMEIIEELESARRGLYGGAVGYFGPDGDLDSCIVLRTAVFEGDELRIQAGAGIVADSDAAAEQDECLTKASALFAAAEDAARS